MIVGSVKELKDFEARVGLMPSHVVEYVANGHQVLVEQGLGLASGFSDEDCTLAVATICTDAKTVWDEVELMIKVKEPIPCEYEYLREGLILYTYLHLASNPELTSILLDKKVSAIAYETVTDNLGGLPLLKPMSEVAGRLSIQQGSKYLEKTFGGKGILLSGVPGVTGGHVVILGGGAVGMSACKTALGTGASVSVLDRNIERLAYIEDVFQGHINTIYSDEASLIKELKRADVVVGSVLLPGEKTPKLVRREHLKLMEPGTVLVDVAIDQGGCFETSRPTTHSNPTYIEEGMVHYCVTNIPGAVPKTSTIALGIATIGIGMQMANLGLQKALEQNPHLKMGLNTYDGKICNRAVASALQLSFNPYENLVKAMQWED